MTWGLVGQITLLIVITACMVNVVGADLIDRWKGKK